MSGVSSGTCQWEGGKKHTRPIRKTTPIFSYLPVVVFLAFRVHINDAIYCVCTLVVIAELSLSRLDITVLVDWA